SRRLGAIPQGPWSSVSKCSPPPDRAEHRVPHAFPSICEHSATIQIGAHLACEYRCMHRFPRRRWPSPLPRPLPTACQPLQAARRPKMRGRNSSAQAGDGGGQGEGGQLVLYAVQIVTHRTERAKTSKEGSRKKNGRRLAV